MTDKHIEEAFQKMRDWPLQQRALVWASQGETGVSSLTIFAVMTGAEDAPDIGRIRRNFRYAPPRDPADFRRCYLLLKLIPEWKTRLPEVAERFPNWGGLVQQWDELTQLYEEERENGQCPKLYVAIQKCLQDIDHV